MLVPTAGKNIRIIPCRCKKCQPACTNHTYLVRLKKCLQCVQGTHQKQEPNP